MNMLVASAFAIGLGMLAMSPSRTMPIYPADKPAASDITPAHVPAKHALGLDPRVESGSPTRTCVNSGIYGVSRPYGITE